MVLNGVGKMVEEVWIAIPKHFPNVKLGEFVIMPNHIHGIISITVGAWHAVPAQEVADVGATHPARGGFALRRPYPGFPKVPCPAQSVQSLVHLSRQHLRNFVIFPTTLKNVSGSGIIMNMSSGMSGITRQFTNTSLPIR